MYLPQVWCGVPAKFAGDTLGLEHSGTPLFEAVSYMVFRLHPAELQHLLQQHGLQDAMTQMLGALEDAQENKFRKEAADMLANLDDMDFDGRW